MLFKFNLQRFINKIISDLFMDFLEFHKQHGYIESYPLDNYIVLRRNLGETKLYDPKHDIVYGGPILNPLPLYEDFSDEEGNLEE